MDKTLQVIVMCIVTHLGLMFFLFPSDVMETVDVGHWLPILVGYLLHFAFVALYTKGLAYYDRHDLIDIFLTGGRTIAVLLLLPLAVYFIMVNIITVRAYSEIITIVFLSNTPLWAIMALLLTIPTYIAMTGIESIFRTGMLLAILFLPIVLFVICVSFHNTDWHYLFPLLERDSFNFITERPFLKSLFIFTGSFLFLGFVRPTVTYNRRRILIASWILLPLVLLSVYIPLLTFGQDTASMLQFPFILAVDTIDITWLMFDRITGFFLLGMVTFVMLFVGLVMWATNRLIHRCMPRVRPEWITLMLGMVIFAASLFVRDWGSVHRLFWWNSIFRIYAFSVIPLATYLFGVMKARKLQVSP
ncbi:hypothetical protein FHS18_002133 [Paenibacillus phyllosphaerae]|uniref:Spore germination protein n=1 Tax=Paenibacillus phyllosphaerae TaxID=274593 RepID=A0A7W5FMA9_9BACL|nr:GerAB/ArcD/ProY family transporter [Paenibacillus phyllosphaerae]MBB3110066.1 hypothetical protein [Paenibacillus phyllosphaerae]